MAFKEITDHNFKSEVLESGKLAVVDFTASWCHPCKKVRKSLEELAPDYDSRVVFGEINVETSPAIAQEYGVISLPQVLFFKGGERIDAVHGVLAKPKLAAKIDGYLE
jgi:thioredoxin 1